MEKPLKSLGYGKHARKLVENATLSFRKNYKPIDRVYRKFPHIRPIPLRLSNRFTIGEGSILWKLKFP